jgi:outer membrane receptor protein involved in Fe transport
MTKNISRPGTRRFHRIGVWVLAVTPFLYSAFAAAQTAPAGALEESLQEITVTATKQEEEILRVPLSIAALNQQEMDISGVRTAADIAALTPGFDFVVTPNPTGGGPSSGGSNNIAIRGISSVTGDATTGIYIDDTAIQVRNTFNGTAGSSFPRVFDLQRVEVDRGPQGTLFGAAAEGGAIRFITPDPDLKAFSGYARSEGAETINGGPSYELGAAGGGPIIEDKLGFRVSAWYRNDGGYVDHHSYQTGQFTSNDNWQYTMVLRGALGIAPTEWLTVTPSVYYQRQHSNDTSVYWPTLSDPGTNFVNGNALRLPYTDSYTLSSLKIKADFGFATFTSISSYFFRQNAANADETNFEFASAGFGIYFPTSPTGLVTAQLENNTTQRVWTYELRLQNNDRSARVNWLVGAFYSGSNQHDVELDADPQFANVLAGIGLTPLGYFGQNPLNGIYTYYGDESSRIYQTAGFANVDIRIVNGLTATVGARVSQSRFNYSLFADGPLNGGPIGETGSLQQTPVTPKFGLSWQKDDNNLLYLSIAKGYRIGGVNAPVPATLCATDLANIGLTGGPKTYGSDSLWSYEIGSKNKFNDGRVEITGSVFHIDWTKIQQKLVLPTCAFAFNVNQGDAVSNGFDLDLKALVLDRLLLGLAVGYTDAHYTSTVLAGPTSTVVQNGDTLGQTPWDVVASARYDFPVGDKKGYVRVEDIYRGANSGPYNFQNKDSYNYDPTLVPNQSFNVFNFRTGLNFSGLDISLFANNLFNVHPQLGYSHGTTSSPVYNATTLRPTTIGVTAIYYY